MSVESARPEDLRMDMGALLAAILARAVPILLVTALLLMATYAVLLFVPKMYESSAGLLVEERSNGLARAPNEQALQPSIPVEAMMSSQIELIKSRDTLMAVIDSENLRSEPEFTGVDISPVGMIMQLFGSKPQLRSVDERVLQNLNERLRVVRERDSAVISVLVRSQDPELAARVANAIANAHVRRRTELSLADTAEASGWLQQEIERLRIRVREAENAVAEYRVANDLFAGTNNTSIRDQQLSAIAAQITAAQERKNAALSRANLIRGLLQAGQPIDGIENVRGSVVIQQLSQSRATLQGELAQRSSTLLPNHPTIKALRAQVAEIEEQIALEGRRVADALEAEARIEADLEQSLNDELTRSKITVSTATRDNVALAGLEREAKAQRDLLESYLLKYSDAISRTDASSALPDVRVVTVAAPSVSPASPKTGLILGAVGFVALALQIGGILFGELMSGRALVERRTYRTTSSDAQAEPAAGFTESEEQHIEEERLVAAEVHESEDQVDVEYEELTVTHFSDESVTEPPRDPAADAAFVASDFEDAEFVAALDDDPRQDADAAVGVEHTAAPAYQARPIANAPAIEDEPVDTQPDAGILELDNLSADIAIGRVRVVMLAALTSSRDCDAVSDRLIADALRHGLSVVRVDAGSGRASAEPGLSDLSAELVSFGDVVHKVREGLAEVPWGHHSTIERRSMRPLTLLEALTDIYEVVIVNTGRIGMSSALPAFTGLDCRLVLVEDRHADVERIEAAIEDAAALGFEIAQIVAPSQRQSEVA